MSIKINNGFVDMFKGRKPVACLARSGMGKEELLDISAGLSKGDSFVLLLRSVDGLADRLLPAFMNAYLRYSENNMRSGSLQKEVLLFAAGTMNIGKAIRSVGIVDSAEFMVFAGGKALLYRFLRLSGSRTVKRCKLSVKKEVAREVAMAGLTGDS